MGARDLVTVDIDKFEELLLDNELSITEAAESWDIGRASLQKIRAGTPVSRALATKIMLRARSKDSILVLQDKHTEDVLNIHRRPFFKSIVQPGDEGFDPHDRFANRLKVDIVPVNEPNWIPFSQSDENQPVTVRYLIDLLRLPRCDDASLISIARPGTHFDMVWNHVPTYIEKDIEAVWHCIEGTFLSNKAIDHLKAIREILKTPRRAEQVGASLDDIIESATAQSGLTEVIEALESEGVAIFGQRIATLMPWEDYCQEWQGIGCDKSHHGFFVIAGSEFDAVELKYGRWVSDPIYTERMSIEKIARLNVATDFE